MESSRLKNDGAAKNEERMRNANGRGVHKDDWKEEGHNPSPSTVVETEKNFEKEREEERGTVGLLGT